MAYLMFARCLPVAMNVARRSSIACGEIPGPVGVGRRIVLTMPKVASRSNSAGCPSATAQSPSAQRSLSPSATVCSPVRPTRRNA
eukprot:4512205-Prymnesium_polylepis.2